MDSEPKDTIVILCFTYFSYLPLAPERGKFWEVSRILSGFFPKTRNGKLNSNCLMKIKNMVVPATKQSMGSSAFCCDLLRGWNVTIHVLVLLSLGYLYPQSQPMTSTTFKLFPSGPNTAAETSNLHSATPGEYWRSSSFLEIPQNISKYWLTYVRTCKYWLRLDHLPIS